jgi:hypothetical protein
MGFFATDPQEPLVNDFDLAFAASDETLHDKSTISNVKTSLPKLPRPLKPRDPSGLARDLAPNLAQAQGPLMFAASPSGCPDSAFNASLFNEIYNRVVTLQNTSPTFRQVIDISARLAKVEARQVKIENRQTEMESQHKSMEARQTTVETRQATMGTESGDL